MPVCMDFEGSLLGECLGNYRLVRMIGCGSMGEVYEAEHVLIGRRVAVKVLLQSLSRSAEAVSRFFTEARTAATMRHPGIVEVFDFGYHPNGSAFIIMELLEGETVTETVERRGPLPVLEAVAIARKLASAMACAHACGVIHRDLKPENLFLVPDEDISDGTRLKVLDFGIAKLATASLFGSRSTRTGQIMGTPAFMSPEQCHGASDVDERADIYALGCILYFMLTGRPPFDSEGVGEVIAQQLYDTPLAPDKHVEGIPARVNAIVMHLLEKNPDDRPGSMDDVAALLNSWLQREADSTVPLNRARIELELAVPTDLPPSDSKPNPVTIMPEPYYSLIDIGAPPLESTAQVPRLTASKRRAVRRSWRNWLAGSAVALTTVGALSWRSMRDGLEDLVGQLPSLEAAAAAEQPELVQEVMTPSAPGFTGAPRVPAARMVALHITSRPTGATVVRSSDGARLGSTPLAIDVPARSGATELRLSKQGFVSEAINLPADRDAQASIVLAPRPAPPSPPVRTSAKRLRAASIALGATTANVAKVKQNVKEAALTPSRH